MEPQGTYLPATLPYSRQQTGLGLDVGFSQDRDISDGYKQLKCAYECLIINRKLGARQLNDGNSKPQTSRSPRGCRPE